MAIPPDESPIYITAVRLAPDRDDVQGITHVRWESQFTSGEDRIQALIVWIGQCGDAYVQLRGGWLGPQLDIAERKGRRYVRSNLSGERDDLLTLPRF